MKLIYLLSGLFLLQSLWAQDDPAIKFVNPSFEDLPQHSMTPGGWADCAIYRFPLETPPDIQPNGEWGVYRPPYHGKSYLGMVTRENDSWESVGQRLEVPITPGQCYYFGIYLCRSMVYKSAVRSDDGELDETKKNFTTPIRLRIWGGTEVCDRTELLAESGAVNNYEWKLFHFKFEPQQDIDFITLEAYYKTPTLFAYNGNLLLDKASDIVVIPCDQDRPIITPPIVEILQPIEKVSPTDNLMLVKGRIRYVSTREDITFVFNDQPTEAFRFDAPENRFEAKVRMNEGKNILFLHAKNEGGADSDQTTIYIKPADVAGSEEPEIEISEEPIPEEPKTEFKILETLNDKEFSVGQTINIDRLLFPADKSIITDQSKPVLEEVYLFMKENPNFIIEIAGHASAGHPKITDDYCDRLSRARAKAVAEFLYEKGIKEARISFKGYGKRRPIASNRTQEGRKKNQRVEIKILSIG